jgi:prepilin-type N-terminal cleavage/methylation domain-containing protein
MRLQKGFTLIELMVVIVIIGILSALAIPKMFGVSAKAKVAEAPGVLANFETLQSAYAQETGAAGTLAQIGFVVPVSKWWTYPLQAGNLELRASTLAAISTCNNANAFSTTYVVATDTYTHAGDAACRALAPNF